MTADAGRRRALLAGSALTATALVRPEPASSATGADRGKDGRSYPGAIHDDDVRGGHTLREAMSNRGPVAPGAGPQAERVAVLIVGAGIAGLAAARALRRAGIDDYCLLELGASAGGNSRAGRLGELACPTGAHYLPLPGPEAIEVQELLTELGVCDSSGAWDERMLIHSPQERLFLSGTWQEGLLPMVGQPRGSFEQYRRFASTVARWRDTGVFTIPVARARQVGARVGGHRDADLKRQTFAHWLDHEGYDAPGLRWYLDYCCRDDYGAGIAVVSAWAGIHYFASRHGFSLPAALGGMQQSSPGSAAGDPVRVAAAAPLAGSAGATSAAAYASDADGRWRGRDAMLTWPEGNGWLAERLAAPHRERLRTRHLVRQLVRGGKGSGNKEGSNNEGSAGERSRSDAECAAGGWLVEALDLSDPERPLPRRWQAGQVIWAAPTHVAARVVDAPAVESAWLAAAASQLSMAPWLVANILVDEDWQPSGGELAWDNVIFGGIGLGYVNARHQRLDRLAGPSLLTWYQALGGRADARAWLLEGDFQAMAGQCIAELSRAHPEIGPLVRDIAVHRWGHAMAIPTPAAHASEGLARLRETDGDLLFAHSDLSGYSVFEEAMQRGSRAGQQAAARLQGGAAPDCGPAGLSAASSPQCTPAQRGR